MEEKTDGENHWVTIADHATEGFVWDRDGGSEELFVFVGLMTTKAKSDSKALMTLRYFRVFSISC